MLSEDVYVALLSSVQPSKPYMATLVLEMTAGLRSDGGCGEKTDGEMLQDREVEKLPRGACGGPGAEPEGWGQALALPGHSAQTLWHSSAPNVAVPQERPQTGDLGAGGGGTGSSAPSSYPHPRSQQLRAWPRPSTHSS